MKHLPDIAAPRRLEHYIATPLGRLFVAEHNRGFEQPAIVLWPSIFTDHRIYGGLVERLGARYRFVLIDGPGHGMSDGPTDEFTMEACAQSMMAVMDQLGLDRAIVGGTSWGGITAAHLALAAPERTSALMLINTPFELGERRADLKAWMIAVGARWMPGARIFRDGVAGSFFSEATLRKHTPYLLVFHEMMQNVTRRPFGAAIRSVLLHSEPLKDRISDLSVPTLVIAGRQDAMYPIERQIEAAQRLPLGRFEAVSGKHISVVDCVDEVAAVVDRFVTSVQE